VTTNCAEQGSLRKRSFGWHILRIIGFVVGGVCLAGLFALVLGIIFQWLWNWLMPNIFSLKEITFWQSVGLLFMARLLFGAMGHRHGSHHPRKRCFHRNGDHWSKYKRFWHEEGDTVTDELIERAKSEKAS
jgi:hypothetical protein